jgi:phosphatidylglycerophosphatase A
MNGSHKLGLSPWHPAMLVATWFGCGLLPIAPGTWGSLAALPFAWAIAVLAGPSGLIAAALVVFLLGWWAAHVVSQASGIKDPGAIVVDEVAGQWLTLAAAPLDPLHYGAGFLLFRLFDILKPWPASWADRRLPGGFGVMADDIFAALYAAAVLVIGRMLLERP